MSRLTDVIPPETVEARFSANGREETDAVLTTKCDGERVLLRVWLDTCDGPDEVGTVFLTADEAKKLALALREYDHSSHGRADEDGAPYDPDCSCRGTPQQPDCAAAGCGFCRVVGKRE